MITLEDIIKADEEDVQLRVGVCGVRGAERKVDVSRSDLVLVQPTEQRSVVFMAEHIVQTHSLMLPLSSTGSLTTIRSRLVSRFKGHKLLTIPSVDLTLVMASGALNVIRKDGSARLKVSNRKRRRGKRRYALKGCVVEAGRKPARELLVPRQVVRADDLAGVLRVVEDGVALAVRVRVARRLRRAPLHRVAWRDLTKHGAEQDLGVRRVGELGVVCRRTEVLCTGPLVHSVTVTERKSSTSLPFDFARASRLATVLVAVGRPPDPAVVVVPPPPELGCVGVAVAADGRHWLCKEYELHVLPYLKTSRRTCSSRFVLCKSSQRRKRLVRSSLTISQPEPVVRDAKNTPIPPHCPQTWDCATARATKGVSAKIDFIVGELLTKDRARTNSLLYSHCSD